MIQINNMFFNYRKQADLFSELNLKVESGSIVGLLGKNGAGKSTLLKLMSGLLMPKSGEINILGFKPGDRCPDFLADVFLIPEEIALPPIKIDKYIRASAALYARFDHEKMERILQDFDLEKEMRLDRMSYGQKKKFIIAFALSTNCKLLILDEPTNGLDIPSKALFRKVVASALTDEQMVVISTHQVRDVENLIDQVLMLNHGGVVLNASLFEIAERYNFVSTTQADLAEALYQEEVPGGYRAMVPAQGEETEVDLEVLFNAVLQGKYLEQDSAVQ